MLLVIFITFLTKTVISIEMEVHEKYLTMDLNSFIEYFNSQNFSYKVTDYNRTFYYGVQEITEDFEIPREHITRVKNLPANFDARQQWPHCETIKEVHDQGECGSCWTFGTGNSASDRTCIHKNVHIHLAEQDFECCKDHVCEGIKDPGIAFAYWKNKGIVSNKCKPYDIEKLNSKSCELQCVDNSISYEKDKHYAERVYKLEEDVEAIKSEIFKNGPIQAGFHVYEDFEKYKSGIYEHKFGRPKGHHSVRVIGYGVEGDKEYWLAVNSWGESWGEGGLFRIRTKQNVEFESYMWAGIPKN